MGFEKFKLVFDDLSDNKNDKQEEQKEVKLSYIQQKLFVDEFFSYETRGQILPPEIQHYDMKQMNKNELFLNDLFKVPATILPMQNLGEIAQIMEQPKSSFCLLDMCLKLYKNKDPLNLSKFKTLAMIGSLLESAGDMNSMQ